MFGTLNWREKEDYLFFSCGFCFLESFLYPGQFWKTCLLLQEKTSGWEGLMASPNCPSEFDPATHTFPVESKKILWAEQSAYKIPSNPSCNSGALCVSPDFHTLPSTNVDKWCPPQINRIGGKPSQSCGIFTWILWLRLNWGFPFWPPTLDHLCPKTVNDSFLLIFSLFWLEGLIFRGRYLFIIFIQPQLTICIVSCRPNIHFFVYKQGMVIPSGYICDGWQRRNHGGKMLGIIRAQSQLPIAWTSTHPHIPIYIKKLKKNCD